MSCTACTQNGGVCEVCDDIFTEEALLHTAPQKRRRLSLASRQAVPLDNAIGDDAMSHDTESEDDDMSSFIEDDEGAEGEEGEEDSDSEASDSSSYTSEDDEEVTEDVALAQFLKGCEVDDASEDGYSTLQVLSAIATKTYTAVRSQTPVPISSVLGVCFSDAARPLVNHLLTLKAMMDRAGVQLPDELCYAILCKLHPQIDSKRPLDGIYVVSIDPLSEQNYKHNLLPLLLPTTGVHVVADVEDGELLAPPYMTGFVAHEQLKFPKGKYGSIGCFCRQKNLRNLYGVRHRKSGIVFFVGCDCCGNFNQDTSEQKFPMTDLESMPPYLKNVHQLALDGIAHIAQNVVKCRGR